MIVTVLPDDDKPHAGFAQLTDNYWLVNVTTHFGATGGEGISKREALASIGLGADEVAYLMEPNNHSIEDIRDV